MVGSSSTMAMRRDIAGEYSPSRAHPNACHRFARNARRLATAASRRFKVSNAFQNSKREARMKHLVRFLGLAAGLAFAAGMVLAGIALLLAMPAYADESGLRLRHRDGGESIAAVAVPEP